MNKKIRFEVFKRDSFTCQYCGRSAPEIVLNIDHIHPRAKGGDDDILNLVTSCYDCNMGKRDRELSDDAVIKKRQTQLNLLQERREQLDMMMAWQEGLTDIEGAALDQLAQYWTRLCPAYVLSALGLNKIRRYLRRFSVPELAEAMRIAVTQYGEPKSVEDETPTPESIEIAFDSIPGIAVVEQRSREKPYLRDLYYIRGILRNKVDYCDNALALELMEDAINRGASVGDLRALVLRASSWTAFKRRVVELENSSDLEM